MTALRPTPPSRIARRPPRGVSIVELMVGITIGLFILAAATVMLTSQLADNRRLLLEAQVQQDLRATADLIARDIRRAGYWAQSYRQVWPASAAATNPYGAMTLRAADAGSTQVIYDRSTDEEGGAVSIGTDDNLVDAQAGRPRERVGFQLGSSNDAGTIEYMVGANNWQSLTDPAVLNVTRFDVVLTPQDRQVPCGVQCPALGANGCPLWQTTRDVTITIVAQAVHDANVRRSLSDSLRLRNDLIREVCP